MKPVFLLTQEAVNLYLIARIDELEQRIEQNEINELAAQQKIEQMSQAIRDTSTQLDAATKPGG